MIESWEVFPGAHDWGQSALKILMLVCVASLRSTLVAISVACVLLYIWKWLWALLNLMTLLVSGNCINIPSAVTTYPDSCSIKPCLQCSCFITGLSLTPWLIELFLCTCLDKKWKPPLEQHSIALSHDCGSHLGWGGNVRCI